MTASSLMTTNITLDATGTRVYVEGKLNYEFQCFHDCIVLGKSKEHEVVMLKEDCKVAFTSRSIDVEDQNYSSGTTFFVHASATPRCYLEKLALAIFRFHTQDAVFDAINSGAEWWTQVIDSRDNIGWHWDRDYGLEEDQGVHIHPHLATVTYLTDCGGPTLILNKVGSLYSHEDITGSTNDDVVISRPRFCKHIKFDGRLLHAAPSDFIDGAEEGEEEEEDSEEEEEEEQEVGKEDADGADGNREGSDEEEESEEEEDEVRYPKRVTFLVNIWLNHVPEQSKPFPADQVNLLRTPVTTGPVSFVRGGDKGPVAIEVPSFQVSQLVSSGGSSSSSSSSSSSKNGTHSGVQHRSWRFTNSDNKYRIRMQLPPASTLVTLADSHDAFHLLHAGNTLS